MGDWLEQVVDYLHQAPGGREQKRAAYEAARDVADVPPPMGDMLRRVFWKWLEQHGYLQPTWPVEQRLPEKVDVQGKSDKEIEHIDRAAKVRAQRCADFLADGWLEEDCLCFVCSREEWRDAKARSVRA